MVSGNQIFLINVSCNRGVVTDSSSPQQNSQIFKDDLDTVETLWGWIGWDAAPKALGELRNRLQSRVCSQPSQETLPRAAAGLKGNLKTKLPCVKWELTYLAPLGSRRTIICPPVITVVIVVLACRRCSGKTFTPLRLSEGKPICRSAQRTSSCSSLTWLFVDKMRTSASSSLCPLTFY